MNYFRFFHLVLQGEIAVRSIWLPGIEDGAEHALLRLSLVADQTRMGGLKLPDVRLGKGGVRKDAVR